MRLLHADALVTLEVDETSGYVRYARTRQHYASLAEVRDLHARLGPMMLPFATEGFFLPGLEALALGVAAVVPDCIGNRDYLAPGANALAPPLDEAAIVAAVERLDDPGLRTRLVDVGHATAARFTLARERACVHDVLDRLDALWAA